MERDELFFLIFIGLILIIGIGFSVVHVIDRKISNIAIRIPDIKLPKPNVVVKMCDNNKNNKKTDKKKDMPDISIDSDTSYMSSFGDNSIDSETSIDDKDKNKDNKEKTNYVVQYPDVKKEETRPRHVIEGFGIKGYNTNGYVI